MIDDATQIALAILKTNCSDLVHSAARNVITAGLDLILFQPNLDLSTSRGTRIVNTLEQRKSYNEAYRRSVEALTDALRQVVE